MIKYIHNRFVCNVLLFCTILFSSTNSLCIGYSTLIADSSKQVSEYQIKAVYLYNFLLFAKWPDIVDENEQNEDQPSEICIGIVGKDPFGDSFDKVEGKIIRSLNKRLVIKRYGTYQKHIDLSKCRLLYISPSEKSNLSKIIKELNGRRTLTVADMDGFLDSGGMINLVTVKNKIRWEINLTPLVKNQIKLSSQILRVAVKVVGIPKKSDKEISRKIR